MKLHDTPLGLHCTDATAPQPVLQGMQAQGRLDAALFELTLRQTYRNTSDRPLEVVYSFALPANAVLLGFVSELNGERREGVMVARPQAEKQYERALAEGDSPVMLENLGDGLHSANIGNLAPGDEIVLECRYAELLHFDQGRLRLAVPTTTAPRYGNPLQAGLQPQQVPVHSLEVDYPLAVTLSIGATLGNAAIECPTHPTRRRRDADGAIVIELAAGARMDRDVIVLVTPAETRPSLLLTARDGFNPSAPLVALAALQPAQVAPRQDITLKLLVDCSGSMTGDSIASARQVLEGALASLGPADRVSLSRFGSSVEHLCEPMPAREPDLVRLRQRIAGIDADLGGTEMEAALRAVIALPCTDVGGAGGADLLLITDGQVWQQQEMLDLLKASGHRVFAIGVGSAPAESVLRQLAEASGGACEFATPGEALQAAAGRMLARMRQPRYRGARIDWGAAAAPAWAVNPPAAIFGGDTVLALAGFGPVGTPGTVRLLAEDEQGRTQELARSEAGAPVDAPSLARIAASRRLAAVGSEDALALALQYQLLSEHTHCILVHRRADKVTEEAELHRVAAMPPAGWHGLGSVQHMAMASLDMAAHRSAHMEYSMPSPDMMLCEDWFGLPPLAYGTETQRNDAPAPIAAEPAPALGLQALAQWVAGRLASGLDIGASAATQDGLLLDLEVHKALTDAAVCGLDERTLWLLLANWLNEREGDAADADLRARLQPLLAQVDPAQARVALLAFECRLGGNAAQPPTRAQRLLRRMGMTRA